MISKKAQNHQLHCGYRDITGNQQKVIEGIFLSFSSYSIGFHRPPLLLCLCHRRPHRRRQLARLRLYLLLLVPAAYPLWLDQREVDSWVQLQQCSSDLSSSTRPGLQACSKPVAVIAVTVTGPSAPPACHPRRSTRDSPSAPWPSPLQIQARLALYAVADPRASCLVGSRRPLTLGCSGWICCANSPGNPEFSSEACLHTAGY